MIFLSTIAVENTHGLNLLSLILDEVLGTYLDQNQKQRISYSSNGIDFRMYRDFNFITAKNVDVQRICARFYVGGVVLNIFRWKIE